MGSRRIGARAVRAVAGGVVAALAVMPATAFASGPGHGGSSGPRELWRVGGLANPRGVSVGLDGSVYVAESGVGGPTPARGKVAGEPANVCLGNTGAVTRIRRGQASTLASFPSMTAAAGTEEAPSCDPSQIGAASIGPSDVAVQLDGSVLVTMGLGADEAVRSQLPAPFGDFFGRLFEVSRRGNVSAVADISGYEESANPDEGEVDSNPYGVTTFFGTHYVADAGGNDIVKVDRRGRVSTLAVIPGPGPVPTPQLDCGVNTDFGLPPAGTPIPAQAVPTSVVIGPDGFVYAAQLTGFPFAPEQAKVFRINPWTGRFTVVAEGFTNVVGLAFGPDRSMYVLEIARKGLLQGEICGELEGRLWKVRNGQRTEIAVPGGLTAPGGVAVGLDGTIYVTNNSIQPGGAGEVIAFRP